MMGNTRCLRNISRSSDRLPPPCPAPPSWDGNLPWGIVLFCSGDKRVFGSGGKARQVELGDFAAASMRGSAVLASRLLLRKVVGC